MPYRTQPSRRRTRDKPMSTQDRGFPGSLLACMKGICWWLLSQTYQTPIAWNHQYALMSMIISSHKITDTPCHDGVVTVSNNTQNIMPGFRMLAFKLWRGRVHSKTFWKFPSPSKNPILTKFKLTHNFKTLQIRCLENFQINMKIN